MIGLCECRDDLQVVGAAACGKAALDAAGRLDPDIMLLDVELPDMSGFDLLRAAAAGTRPLGIMVSNCTDHATRAFEEGAFDYLVMPVAAERFDRAINPRPLQTRARGTRERSWRCGFVGVRLWAVGSTPVFGG